VAYCKTQHTNALRNVQITCTGGNRNRSVYENRNHAAACDS
jgi:hypothetical protein